MTRHRPDRLEDAVKEALDTTLNILAHLAKDAANCVDDTARLAHARDNRTDFDAALDCSLCSRTCWMRMSACTARYPAGCNAPRSDSTLAVACAALALWPWRAALALARAALMCALALAVAVPFDRRAHRCDFGF
jgi:hypothetical protein